MTNLREVLAANGTRDVTVAVAGDFTITLTYRASCFSPARIQAYQTTLTQPGGAGIFTFLAEVLAGWDLEDPLTPDTLDSLGIPLAAEFAQAICNDLPRYFQAEEQRLKLLSSLEHIDVTKGPDA